MNYLAHLYLADDAHEAVIGSLMGDFVKGPVEQNAPAWVRPAVIQHRRIDSFTDAHAIVRQSKQRIGPEFRRYAGILIDMFYDHFLAVEWHTYAHITLSGFTSRVYEVIDQHLETLPEAMRPTMAYMLGNDLLGSYQRIEGIGRALRGIESRLRRPSRLGAGIGELERLYPLLRQDFHAFFPELVCFVDREEYQAGRSSNADLCHRRRFID